MNWLFPGFLAGALAIGLPILLHFLRSKPKRVVPFPSLRFLGPSALRDTRSHRLRRWLTLLLRCLVIGLLAAAFARPFFARRDAAQHQVMLVAVDNSMSLQAGNRWEDQRRWALRQLDDLSPGDSAGLLLMHPAPTWLAPVSSDLARVRATLQAAQPGYEKTRFGGALRLAGSVLAAHPAKGKTLVWLSDQQRLGWQGVQLNQPLPPGVKIRFGETPAEPTRQAAITAMRQSGDKLEVSVRLFEPQWESRQITVLAGGETLVTQSVSLVRGENKFSFPLKSPVSDGLRVELEPDDLPADDVAWIANQSDAHDVFVLLDHENKTDTDFLAHALNSTRRLAAGSIHAADLPAGTWPAKAVAILRGSKAFSPKNAASLDQFTKSGGGLCLFYDGSAEQARWLEKRGVRVTAKSATADGEPRHLRDWDVEHPALAAFSGGSVLPLMEVEFYQGGDLSGDGLIPLARWEDGGIALAELSGGHVLVAGFRLQRASTNWPVQASFVPFVHGAASWLLSQSQPRGDWHIGDTIPLATAGTWRALNSPRPETARQISGNVRPSAPGLYEFVSGQRREIYAVNVPPEESDLAPWPRPAELLALENTQITETPDTPRAAAVPLSDELSETQQRLWWWLLAFCAVVLCGELALANRTAP